MASPGIKYFFTLSQKDKVFEEKKGTEHKMCVFISLHFLSEIFFILR